MEAPKVCTRAPAVSETAQCFRAGLVFEAPRRWGRIQQGEMLGKGRASLRDKSVQPAPAGRRIQIDLRFAPGLSPGWKRTHGADSRGRHRSVERGVPRVPPRPRPRARAGRNHAAAPPGEGQIEYKGMVFLPKLVENNVFERGVKQSNIKLYVRIFFITDRTLSAR